MTIIEKRSKLGSNDPGASSGEKDLSIKEFFLLKKPTGDVRRTLVFAYYLEKYRGQKSFTKTDIENAYKEAKEQSPTNASDTIAKNVAQGFLMVDKDGKDKKMAWTLTNTGSKAVEVLNGDN